MKKKKALVLGGSGYLGRALLQDLMNKDYDLSALIHHTPLPQSLEEVKVFRSSLSGFDWQQLESDLPDVIFHSARLSGHTRRTRLAAARVNARANDTLIRWMQSLQNPPLLIFVSGTLVYGSHGTAAVDENARLSPISFQREYHHAEIPIINALEEGKLPIIIVRPSWIYGEGSWFDAFYLNVIRQKSHVPVYGKGDNLMSFIHVEDAAAMTTSLAEKGEAGEIYNLFSGPAISQKGFAGVMSDIVKMPVKHVPYWWLRLRHGKAIAEAFTFSLDVRTKHKNWHDSFSQEWTLEAWLREILPPSS